MRLICWLGYLLVYSFLLGIFLCLSYMFRLNRSVFSSASEGFNRQPTPLFMAAEVCKSHVRRPHDRRDVLALKFPNPKPQTLSPKHPEAR